MIGRRIAILLFCAGLLCLTQETPTSAQFNNFPPGMFSNRAYLYPAPGGFDISLTDRKTDTVGGGFISYGSANIGASNANRVIVVSLGVRDNNANTDTLVQVNGINATQVVSAQSTSISMTTDLWFITESTAMTSGLTAATIGVQYSASIRSEVAIYRLVTTTPTPSVGNNARTAASCTSVSQTITIPANGAGLGVVAGRNTGTTTWTAMSADFDDQIAALHQFSGAHSTAAGSTTFNPTWGASVADCELSVAAWSP